MRRFAIITTILLVAQICALSQTPAAQPAAPEKPAASYKDLQYPALHKIAVPTPLRFELPNGMVVYMVEDHELPMVTVAARIRTGDRWEPVSKAGLAWLTGEVMRTGGTPGRSGDQLDDELDRLGASVEISIGEDSGSASVSVLKEDTIRGIGILADLLRHPAFPQDKIELAKIMLRESIARRNDEASEIADREFERLMYGKDSAYGHQPEYDTIAAITRDDLVAFHKQFFQPENVILGIWGDFDSRELRRTIGRIFNEWPRGGNPKPAVPAVDPGIDKRTGVYLIEKDDVNQSMVHMGLPGGKRSDPDYFALTVANRILGGGFGARLFNKVRSEEGLAYSVYSSWGADWDHTGIFQADGTTKSTTTVQMIAAMKREIARMSEGEVTDEELARAKDAILKGSAFDNDSTGKIVGRLMTYEYFGYPSDFLQRFDAGIGKVTKADVLRVSKQHFTADRFAVVVLGNSKAFDKPLSTLGPVTMLDISIPKPKQTVAAASADDVKRGMALLAEAREAMGGAAIGKVKAYTGIGSVTMVTEQGDFSMKVEETTDLSSKMVQKLSTPGGEIVTGYDGKTMWMKTPQGAREAPASELAEMEANFFRETLWILQAFDSGKVKVQALTQPGADLEGVAVSDPARNLVVKVYLDPKTHIIVKKEFVGSVMGPPAPTEEAYSDYRDAAGVKVPFVTVVSQDGKKKLEQDWTEVKINPSLGDSAYKKP